MTSTLKRSAAHVDDDPYRDLIPTPDFAGLALDGDYEGRHRLTKSRRACSARGGYRIYRDWQDRGGLDTAQRHLWVHTAWPG